MTQQFTGRHMAAIMIAFFAVVISVNVVMARSAIGTFGGVVVENSYVASQRYNMWLSAAAAQDRLGWRAHASAVANNRIVVDLAGRSGAIAGAAVTVDVEHPLGRLPGQHFKLTELRPGVYTAAHSLPSGRWRLRIEARSSAGTARFIEDIRL